MQGFQKLQYFSYILWIDQNPNIQYQLKNFQFVFKGQVQLYKDLQKALQLASTATNERFIIICPSRLIQDINKLFQNVFNCFPKYLIFCGSQSKCDQIQNKYKQIVYKAQFNQDRIIVDIINLEEQIKGKNIAQIVWITSQNNSQQQILRTYGSLLKKIQFDLFARNQFISIKNLSDEISDKKFARIIFMVRNNHSLLKDFQKIHQATTKYKNIMKIFLINESRLDIKKNRKYQQFQKQCQKIQEGQNIYIALKEFLKKLDPL